MKSRKTPLVAALVGLLLTGCSSYPRSINDQYSPAAGQPMHQVIYLPELAKQSAQSLIASNSPLLLTSLADAPTVRVQESFTSAIGLTCLRVESVTASQRHNLCLYPQGWGLVRDFRND